MSKRTARKKFLVDPSMQLSVTASMAGTLIALSTIYLTAVIIVARDPNQSPTSAEAMNTGILVAGVYFAIAAAASIFMGIVSTHRIAGPAIVIERALRAIRSGNLGERLTLRDRDHLQSLALELDAHRQELQQAADDRRELFAELETALDAGDLAAARSLCRGASEESDDASEVESRAA